MNRLLSLQVSYIHTVVDQGEIFISGKPNLFFSIMLLNSRG